MTDHIKQLADGPMTEAEQERAEIVAWLREQAICGCNGEHGWCNQDGPPLAFADAIEALAHKQDSQ